VTKQGIIVVTQSKNNCVQLFDERGRFLFQFGCQGKGDLQFDHPIGVAIGSEGTFFIADCDNNQVQEVEVRPMEWRPSTHKQFGKAIQKGVEAVLMMWRRQGEQWNVMGDLPLEVVHMIVQLVVSSW
jgi:DNA-binding beta-propeller fold protein YncE